jgi:hypothetical protein
MLPSPRCPESVQLDSYMILALPRLGCLETTFRLEAKDAMYLIWVRASWKLYQADFYSFVSAGSITGP